MARRIPPLNSLKAFEAAARYLSFTKASEELFVTQAAVSHQIKTLEDFLGVKLFKRRNRNLLLTEEGQSYFYDIKDVFASLSDATDKVLERGAKGSITVSLQPSFAIQWLVPKLAKFNDLEPDIDVRIKAVDANDGSLTDDVDVAIYYGKGKWSDLRVDKLYQEYLIPVCSPMLLNSEKPIKSVFDLNNQTLLHDTSRKSWKNFFKENNIDSTRYNQGPIFSHSSMVLQAAVYGQGIALANNILAKPELETKRLVVPFSEKLMSKNSYYLVSSEKNADFGKISAFRKWILEEAMIDNQQML